jgi:parvulin-like peptidyl-prolyl isomerase
MKRFLLLCALLGGTVPGFAAAPPVPGVLLDSYAAIVNGKVITVGDVLAAMQPLQERLAARLQGAELQQRLAEEYHAIRNSLVESELILLDFELQGGDLPDRAIEDHINSVILERFGNNRAEFLRALAAERLTFADWRKQMKDQLIVQIMRQREVLAKILITPLDLQQAYDRNRDTFARPERVHLRTRILGPANADGSPEETRARALDVRNRLASGDLPPGDAPGTLADPEWFDTANLNDAIRDAIAGLAPDGIAEPIELGGDLYLVQLLDRQEARVLPLDEVSPDLERELRRSEYERLNRIWIDTLRAKYFVQLFTHSLFD